MLLFYITILLDLGFYSCDTEHTGPESYDNRRLKFIALHLYATTIDFKSNNQDVIQVLFRNDCHFYTQSHILDSNGSVG